MNKNKFICFIVILLSFISMQTEAQETQPTATDNIQMTPEANTTASSGTFVLAPLEEIRLEPPTAGAGANGELQRWLEGGTAAPWSGVLLNPSAMAYIITEYEAVYSRAAAALTRQRDSDTNRIHLEVGRLQLRLETTRQQYEIELSGRDREISRLQTAHQALINQNKKSIWKNIFTIGGTTIASIIVGILIGYFVIPGR